jgi:NADH dehydrogenase FAD-containing subunit
MFKTEADLIHLRKTLDHPSKVVVLGAGPTGLELACKLTSLGHKITVVEASKTVLPGFSKDFQTLTLQHLQAKGIELKLDNPVTAVTKTQILTKTEPIQSIEPVIWTCGIKPVPFVKTLAHPKQHLSVNSQLQFSPHVYAVGDSIIGKGPPTAQNARQQGEYLATLFNSDFRKPDPYTYLEQGRVLDIATGYIVEWKGHVVHVPSWLSVFINLARE